VAVVRHRSSAFANEQSAADHTEGDAVPVGDFEFLRRGPKPKHHPQ